MKDHPFTVFEGATSRSRKPYRRVKIDEPEQVTCHECEADTGVATSAVIQMFVAPMRTADGRKAGGTKEWICPYCLTRGKVTRLIR